MRLSYPVSVRIIKVPCTGRVDPVHVMRAFEEGADGLYLVGCLEGDCRFLSGNVRARKRIDYLKGLLDECGIGGGRLEMYNVSSADGHRFAEIASEMTERVRVLGASPAGRKGRQGSET